MHHLVRLTIDGEDSDVHLSALIKSWRFARTSELADVIEALTRRKARTVQVPRLDEPDGMERWRVACASASPFEFGWLLESLADQAAASWESRDQKACWCHYTRCVELLVERDPDPRIGRAIEDALRGPGDHWFRTDQVNHIVTSFPQKDDAPSFADYAFTLLERNGDAGSAKRLRGLAKLLLEEADCNRLDMSEMLDEIATMLKRRWPNDEMSDDAVLEALSVGTPPDAAT